MRYDVQVSYTDNDGEQYRDPLALDLDMYLGTGGVTINTINDVHKRLEELVREIKTWRQEEARRWAEAGGRRR